MHRLPGWLILAALLALTVLAFGCAGDDDDSGGDDTGDDDDDDWENDPAIQSNAVDPIDALTPAALSALEAAPEWIYYDLLETFNRLGDANQDRWANLILDASDDRYVDELAFLVAHSSLTDLMYEGYLPELLEENVASIYETAEALPYVTLIEVDDGARNDYTTLEYALPDGDTFELFRDDYLWYVVHPRRWRTSGRSTSTRIRGVPPIRRTASSGATTCSTTPTTATRRCARSSRTRRCSGTTSTTRPTTVRSARSTTGSTTR